jgi:hypothetical protein
MVPRGLCLHAGDNVAVLLCDVQPGPVEVLGQRETPVIATEAIRHGHKIALQSIGVDAEVIKYGVPIGFATATINAGAWVHTHNCRSRLDDRSHTLDPHSGAPTDTRYL